MSTPLLPRSLRANPRLSQWLRLCAEGVVEVRPGKVEIGQGIATALAQIAASELELDLARIRMVPAVTGISPNEGVTSGSLSIQDCGTALRQVCAEARSILLDEAARRLGVEPAGLRIARDGSILSGSERATSYWALADAGLLDRNARADIAPRSLDAQTLIGAAVPRLDLPDKVFGRPRFVHDLDLPGMLHARVLRPPSPAATLAALDESRAKQTPGVVAVVRDGSFVGAIAEREEVAAAALETLRLAARWNEPETLPEERALAAWQLAQPVETSLIEDRGAHGAAHSTRRARYTRPYLAHASIAPSCAIAHWDGERLEVWSHSQGIYNLRADLSLALDLPLNAITVRHAEGAGCYGHNGADDVAFDAALLARAAAGRPVKLLWSRADELAWAPLGPAMTVELEADLDGGGEITAWRHAIWSNGHGTRPGRAKVPAFLAARHLARPFEPLIAVNAPREAGGGAERNAVPGYDFPALRVVSHRLLSMPLRTSALRSLGAYANVFAIESFLDELAAAQGEDPVDFRLRHLSDPRGSAVIEAAARRSGWNRWRRGDGLGHGIGYARYKGTGAYCAVVAEIEAEREIRVRRLVVAVDVGLVINPDGVANQIEGGAIQAASWTLKEAVRFDRTRITSNAWEDYPILGFDEVPRVEVEIIGRPEQPPCGAGEAAHGPTAAAIGNAVFDALGVRVRDLPLTPERIAAAAN